MSSNLSVKWNGSSFTITTRGHTSFMGLEQTLKDLKISLFIRLMWHERVINFDNLIDLGAQYHYFNLED